MQTQREIDLHMQDREEEKGGLMAGLQASKGDSMPTNSQPSVPVPHPWDIIALDMVTPKCDRRPVIMA